MEPNLIQMINFLGKEKNIPKEAIVDAIQAAILTASRKKYGTEDNIEVEINLQKGEIEAYLYREVVEEVEDADREISLAEAREYDETIEVGDEFAIRLDVSELGRIAAQTAKQVMFQRVREAEREVILREFGGRIGETLNGIVMRIERGNLVVDLGKAEGVLSPRQKIPGERYNRGDRIRALILDVNDSGKTPQVVLSRTDPRFLIKLFEMEVPEIYEGVVKIVGVVRAPGQRAKIAVVSNDSNVDPVGACVGVKGIRVQAVVQELRGEKIDIIPYTERTRDFIEKALSPAAISRIAVNEEERSALVVVEENQLSLAIGKKGQNVRLASELCNYQINLMSEEEYQSALREQQEESEAEKKSLEKAVQSISHIEGVGEKTAKAIVDAGFRSVAELASANPEDLIVVPGVGEKTAEKIIQNARELPPETTEEIPGRETSEGSEPETESPDRSVSDEKTADSEEPPSEEGTVPEENESSLEPGEDETGEEKTEGIEEDVALD